MECYCAGMAEQRALQLARGLVGWWAKLSDGDPDTQLGLAFE